MIHPSYTELLEVINSGSEEGEAPVVNSRYSIVMAAAKRARQIIAGDQNVTQKQAKKPLSTAVSETEEDQNDRLISTVSSVKGSGAFVEFSAEETSEDRAEGENDEDVVWDDDEEASFDDEDADDEEDDQESGEEE